MWIYGELFSRNLSTDIFRRRLRFLRQLRRASSDAQMVAGNYITSRRGETNFLRMGGILNEAQFVAQTDGTIVASQIRGPNGQPRHYREIAPLVFRAEDGEAKLGFVKQSDGRYYIFTSGAASGYQQVPYTESAAFVNFLRNFALIILGLTVMFLAAGGADSLALRKAIGFEHFGSALAKFDAVDLYI